MSKPLLKLVPSAAVFGAVPVETKPQPPRRRPNAEVRSREYLTEAEVERLIKAAASNRYAHRDQTMILVTFRHGLRTIETTRLRWESVDFNRGELHVARAKNGKPGTHYMTGRELRALRRLKREQDPASSYVFTSERGAPFAPRGFRQMIERLGAVAKFEFPLHAHMLRHACGYKLANDGVDTRSLQAYLGHRNINHTVRYTELSPARFKGFWKD
jgi:integrase